VKRFAPWLLAAGSGAAFALALPGAGWAPLVLLFPGLLLEAIERSPGGRRSFLVGWFAGIVHWVIAVNWVLPVMDHYGGMPTVAALGCLVGMGAILGSCWALAAGLTSLVPGRLRVWLYPAAFIALDAWRQFWPLGFPWNPPAAVAAGLPALLGSLPVWGATGLGWAMVAAGAALWALFRPASRRPGLAALGTAAALTVIASVLAPPARPAGEPLPVAVLQPGSTLEEKWDPDEWQEMERRVWALTAEAAARGAKVVLWPESALPFRFDTDPEYQRTVAETARRLGVVIVLNSVAGSAEEGFTNSAFAVGPDGPVGERYDKLRLVPFGEFVPWWARLAFTQSLVREVGMFEPGTRTVLLDAGVPVGMSICYEVVFAELAARQVRGGAELLATLTNDGWYGYSWAPRQHLAQAVLRAVETRRWLARAALTGISAFVDPSGRTVARLEVGANGVLVAAPVPCTGLTPRARLGDWWAAVAAVAALAMLVAGRRRRATSHRFES
jgi:apolipoprotein N-acyltransferase